MDRLVSEAELRALQAQINPHFLFGSLKRYTGLPLTKSDARQVLNLAEIFCYFLQTERTFVSVADEVQIVRSYLAIEKLRLADRLRVEIDFDSAALDIQIPVLSIQPLVENAIKHGVARRTEPGYVRVQGECRDRELFILPGSKQWRAAVPGQHPVQHWRRAAEPTPEVSDCYGSAANLYVHFDDLDAKARVTCCVRASYQRGERSIHRQGGLGEHRAFTSTFIVSGL
jgi:hypothetical protein